MSEFTFQMACEYASATPALLSMLYDLGMMPEQARGTRDQQRFMQVVAHWREADYQRGKYAVTLETATRGLIAAVDAFSANLFKGRGILITEALAQAVLDAGDALEKKTESHQLVNAEPEDYKAQRNALAEAIADAAKKAGIYNGEVALSGPQLIMLVYDMSLATCGKPGVMFTSEENPARQEPFQPFQDGCWLAESLVEEQFLHGPFGTADEAHQAACGNFRHFQIRRVWPMSKARKTLTESPAVNSTEVKP